jgi:mRNA-degrading endonuclease toxin of MazEF toxin-antitoxin module
MSKSDSLNYGTVFTMEFPYANDLRIVDIRPVVVVSGDRFNSIWPKKKVVVAPITTKQPNPLNQYHILVKEGTKEYQESGLLRTSYIRLDKLMSIDEDLVVKFIGRFSQEFMKKSRVSELCKSIFCYEYEREK